MGLRGLSVRGRGGCSRGRRRCWCSPRCARSEMMSLLSQSFSPAVTRQAVSHPGQRGQDWAASPAPTQGKSPQRSCGWALPSWPLYLLKAGSLTPTPLRDLCPGTSWCSGPGSVPVLPSRSCLQLKPRGLALLPPLDSLPGGQLAQTPWPVGLVTACLLAPGTPRSHIFPCRRGWPNGSPAWSDIRCPGKRHQILGPRAPSRLPEWDPPDAPCPQSPENFP